MATFRVVWWLLLTEIAGRPIGNTAPFNWLQFGARGTKLWTTSTGGKEKPLLKVWASQSGKCQPTSITIVDCFDERGTPRASGSTANREQFDAGASKWRYFLFCICASLSSLVIVLTNLTIIWLLLLLLALFLALSSHSLPLYPSVDGIYIYRYIHIYIVPISV